MDFRRHAGMQVADILDANARFDNQCRLIGHDIEDFFPATDDASNRKHVQPHHLPRIRRPDFRSTERHLRIMQAGQDIEQLRLRFAQLLCDFRAAVFLDLGDLLRVLRYALKRRRLCRLTGGNLPFKT